jgi:hypothetical protein
MSTLATRFTLTLSDYWTPINTPEQALAVYVWMAVKTRAYLAERVLRG